MSAKINQMGFSTRCVISKEALPRTHNTIRTLELLTPNNRSLGRVDCNLILLAFAP